MALENVISYFDSVGLRDRVMIFEQSSATVELAALAVGCEPAHIAKTMSFLQGDKAILIVSAGDAKIENNAVVRHVGGWNSIGGSEESDSVKILQDKGLGTVDGTGAGIDVSLDMSDSSKFLEDYEALQAAAE